MNLPHVRDLYDARQGQAPTAPDLADAPPERRTPSERRRFLTDYGNCRRLVERHGDDLRFVREWGWLVWDGRRWARDDSGAVTRMAKSAVLSLYDEAADDLGRAVAELQRLGDAAGQRQAEALLGGDGDGAVLGDTQRAREALEKAQKSALQRLAWAQASQARARLDAMVALAATELEVVARPADFDTDPWLLNCENGTLDLRTGVLREHRRDDLITKLAGTAYDPDADCPLWDDFLLDITEGNEELLAYLQRMAGLALTGDTSEQSFHLLWGTGANGKTTFTGALLALLGEYGMSTRIETLLLRRDNSIPNDVAALMGARLVVASEIPDGRRLNETLIKDVTGGDPITARELYREFFTFTPTFKLWLFGNHRPVIRGTDLGIWRRVRLVPFTVTISPEEQDAELPAKLRGELPGILNWAVEGCLAWQRDGLQPPALVQAATDDYRAEQDVLGAFLADATVQGAGVSVQAAELYAAYVQWCEENGEHAVSGTAFGRAMTERGFVKRKTMGRNVYEGVGLAIEDDLGL